MERSGSSASGLYPPFGRVEGLGIVGLAVAALPGGTGGIPRAAEKDRSVYLWNLVGERLGDQGALPDVVASRLGLMGTNARPLALDEGRRKRACAIGPK